MNSISKNFIIFRKGDITMDFVGYCVKCRAKVDVKKGEIKTTENGRKMVQGVCPKCGTKVTRFLPADKK